MGFVGFIRDFKARVFVSFVSSCKKQGKSQVSFQSFRGAPYDTIRAYNSLFILLPPIIIQITPMEVQSQLVPISSLVPLSSLRPMNTLAKKYWHIICKAEFYIPCGLHVVRLTVFLVSFELRLFLNIAFEILYSLQEGMANVGFPEFAELSSEVAQPSLCYPLHSFLWPVEASNSRVAPDVSLATPARATGRTSNELQ